MSRIPHETLKAEFKRILSKLGFSEQKADDCAMIFANNSRDGVYTHGLNRFPKFVEYIKSGFIDSTAEPTIESANGILERWNGNLAPGMLNARFCMDRAIALAKENGLSCVAIRNTNHWMRGGTYGWQAAEAGCIGICFTNTTSLVPPWGGIDPRLGNNPLIIAVPRKEGHLVLDMAFSQYSGGQLEKHVLDGKQLAVAGGYDKEGNLSKDPQEIFYSKRLLPIGFWKGSGLAMMMDILASVLSKGKTTEDITNSTGESGVSQVFICIHQDDEAERERIVNSIIAYTKTSRLDENSERISYPGENTLRTRLENMKQGIPVNESIWENIQKM
jgi:3-dehydro-L-gulonate 2-dehydrogenase